MSDHDDSSRPQPDHLLSVIQRKEDKAKAGHLKVFLGMVAGVGKTYAMLQRARQLKADGVDAVVGWVDTHGRRETEALLEGLEIFPRQKVTHKGVTLDEMDLDGLLARRPKVVLVDELAHTNAPGSRHPKRHQDVRELLNAGIDVYTTVNIQHLESRVDTVRDITGVTVQETVPDAFIDAADEVVLIDLPPEDLLQRLRDGRIYSSQRADVASKHFFKEGNLRALRELALRAATGRVDRELREYKTLHGINAAWKTSSRLMVAVFASPYSESLIRWTRQLADFMGSSWVGAYVNTGAPQSEEEKRLLEKNTQLVHQLGGDFTSIQDRDLVEGILRIARQNHVTQIVVGKTRRGLLRNFFSGGSVVDKLLKRSGDIDVYVVSPQGSPAQSHRSIRKQRASVVFPWEESGWAAALIFGFWALASFLNPLIGYQAVGIVFLMAVLISGVILSRATVFLVAILLSLIHNFFFIPPLFTFTIRQPHDLLLFLMFFLAAAAIGHLTTRLKRQATIIEAREDRAVQLFNFAHAVAEAQNLAEVIGAAVQAFQRGVGAETSVFLLTPEGKLVTHPGSSFVAEAKEAAVAEWTRQNNSVAGRFTDTLPSSEGIYFPLQSKGIVRGVVGLKLAANYRFDFERKSLAQALAEQLAAGVERERLHESQRRLEMLEQADALYRTLFDSVSHELKTPLTTIKGAVSALQEHQTPASSRNELMMQIQSESERLSSVVDNMLDMTRLESGSIRPKVELCDLADILGPALRRIDSVKAERKIDIVIPADIKPVWCDAPLLVQALTNILHNAIKHTPNGKSVHVSAHNSGPEAVEIKIQDEGPGLPEKAGVVFEKFYRARPNEPGGLGLGLSIAKGFVQLVGGSIEAKNHETRGAMFSIRLPTVKKS